MEFEEYTGEVIPLEGYQDYSGEVLPLGINDQIPTGEGEAAPFPVEDNTQRVEEPTWSFENNVMEPGLPDTFEGFVGGVYNSGRNLIETGLAAGDWLTGGDRAESFSTTVPKYEDPNAGTLQDLVTTGAEIAGGAGVGGALTKGRAALEAFPQFVQKLTKLTLQEAGGAASLDKDSETLFIGEDALVKLWGGLSADDSGNFSEDLLAKRANIFFDAMAIVKPAEMAARGIGSSAKLFNDYVIKPIRKLGDEDTIKKQVAKDMLDALLTITPDDTPEQIASKYANIRQKVDEYKKIVLETGDETLGNVEIPRDTMGAIERDLTPEDSALRARARGLRGGMEGKGSSDLEDILAQPSIRTKDYLNRVKETQGGQESISKTTESIQDRTYEQTNAVIDEVGKAQQRIIDSEEGAKALIRDDPIFGKMLEDLGDEVNIDMTGPNKTLDEILANINEASRIMTDKKNTLWKAIPDDVTVNVETFNNTLESVGKSLDDNLRKSLGEAGDNFKKLDEFASTTLQDAISVAVKSGEFGKVRDLRNLKRHIQDEQLNYIAEEGYEAAEKAYDYYKNTYAPFWRDGPLEDIQRIQRDKSIIKPLEAQYETRKILKNTFGDLDQEGFTQRIIDLLNTEEGKKSSGKVLDYVLGTVAQDVQRILNNGKKKLSPEDISSLSKTLEAYVPIFKKVDETQVSRINEFLTKLRDKNFSTEELKQQLEIFEKQAKTVEEDLLGGKFKEFFRKEGSQYLPRSNTDDIYKSVFDDPDVVDKLPDLIKQAGKENENGLRAAYKDHLLKKILRDEQGLAGEKLASPIKQEELDKLFKTGDILFKDNPKIMEVTRGLIEELRQARQGSRRKLPTFDTSVPRKSASGAIDFVITQIFGVLNRTGARIRSAAGKALSAIDPQDQVKNMMDLMYSNPEEFSRVVKQLEKDAVKGNILTNEKTKRDLYKLFIASNIYGDDPPDEEEFMNGFETYEGSISPTKKKSLDDQTNENLKSE